MGWNKHLANGIEGLIHSCWNRLEADHYVYIKRYNQERFIILLLYVDDMLVVGHDKSMVNMLKKDLGSQFAMKDLGQAQQILGVTWSIVLNE